MKLYEMTMKASNFDRMADEFVRINASRWAAKGKPVGTFDHYTVKQDGIYYSVWDNDQIVGAMSISTQKPPIVDNVWVAPSHRGQKLFSKMLWFAKTTLDLPKLMLGDVHSATTYEIVKGGLSRFTKTWINIRTNETMPHSPEAVGVVYSTSGPTAWRLVLENANDFSSWKDAEGFIRQSYGWQIE